MGEELAVVKGGLAAEGDGEEAAVDGAAMEWCPATFGEQFVVVNGGVGIRVDGDVGVWLGGEVEDALGIGVHKVLELVEGEFVVVDGGEHEAEGGFETGDAWWGGIAFFFGDGVGGVVGGDAVDGGEKVFPEGGDIVGGAEDGAHIGAGAHAGEIGFVHEEVVGGDFAGDGEAGRFGVGDELNFLAAADVTEMDMALVGGGEADADGNALFFSVHGN